MKRGDISHQDAYEVIARAIVPSVAGEPHRHISDNSQVTAQVVRRLLPHFAPRLLQGAQLLERTFEILHVPGGLLLLQGEELMNALLKTSAQEIRPDLPCMMHCIERRRGVLLCIAI